MVIREKNLLTFQFQCSIIYTMKRYSKKPWTHSERTLLRKVYSKSTEDELVKTFPERSINSIRKQVSYLRKRGWTF